MSECTEFQEQIRKLRLCRESPSVRQVYNVHAHSGIHSTTESVAWLFLGIGKI